MAFLADTAHCLQYMCCRLWVALWVVAGGEFHPLQ